MAHKALQCHSSRHSRPLTRYFRPISKKRLERVCFAARGYISTPQPKFLLLIISLAATVLLYNDTIKRVAISHFPDSASVRTSNVETLRDFALDPCAGAVPQLLKHFDPSTRASAEFDSSVASDVDPPGLIRVFTAFFKMYLFEPHSDIVVNLNASGRGRPTDIRDSLRYAQEALQAFYRDDSIAVRGYALGYSHLDRVRGSRYIFHLESSSDSDAKRRDVVAVQRTFDGKCFLSVKQYDSHVFEHPVYMVVPYSRRPTRLKWFLDQFDRLRRGNINIRLIVAACRGNEGDVMVAKQLASAMKFSRDVTVVPVPGDRNGSFSRAVAIREGAKLVPTDSLMFISDVDMYIFPPFFDSCRYNAIPGTQVYFPVFYSLYARSTRIDRDAGYWRDSSHGMSCLYKSDFDEVGVYGEAESEFVGWGGEDVALSQAFVNQSQYEVFRAVEPALRHKWHPKHCKPSTSYDDCIAVSFQQLGTMARVGRFLLDRHIDAQQLFAENSDG